LISLADSQFRVLSCQGFLEKCYPERSEGLDFFKNPKGACDLAGQTGHGITFVNEIREAVKKWHIGILVDAEFNLKKQ
jgi:hypothetical protein